MPSSAILTTYLVSAVLFILSLRGLSTQESARRGNALGVIGMALAVGLTIGALVWPSGDPAHPAAVTGTTALGALGIALLVGAVVGATLAARVQMTSMPELVAVLHSFVGAAAVLVGIAEQVEGELDVARAVEVYVGVFVGAITFTGSVIAFLKLRGTIGSKPLVVPGRHVVNAVMVATCVALSVMAFEAPNPGLATSYLGAMTAVAGVLGAHLVLAIGGGDMPVVVSLLNSYSGWAAAAAGFMLGNDLLIVTGALVGSSGAILSYIMCKAMNRSIWNVVFAGFGEGSGVTPKAKDGGPPKKVIEIDVEGAAELLLAAKSVIVVPGYGMAVAQAQHAVKEITSMLAKRGAKVRYAIHPVAGRLPGHMNVLLAEANVSYDIVLEMEEINEDFASTDVVIVIGANDIVNPSALDDPGSPIYGMPVLEAWKAAKVIMLKRGMAAGYAGVDNPLCYLENTAMLFGDAKASVTKLLAAVTARGAASKAA